MNLGLIGTEFSQNQPGYIAGAIDQMNEQVNNL